MSGGAGVTGNFGLVCPVCLEHFSIPEGTVRHLPVIGFSIPCTTPIHITCLDTWFRQPSAGSSCPTCRGMGLIWFTEVESEDGSNRVKKVSFAEAIAAGAEAIAAGEQAGDLTRVGYRFLIDGMCARLGGVSVS